MSCRQYTCANCWNEIESRCLSCAPLGSDNLSFPATAEPLARILGQTEPEPLAANGHLNGDTGLAAPAQPTPPEASAWPTSDRARDEDPWPGLPALPAVAGQPVDEPSVEAVVEASTAGAEAVSDAPEATAAEIAPVEAAPVPEVVAQDDIVDEDVALAVAAAELARHAAAEADTERQRLAAEEAEAERQRLAAEEAEAEQARQAVAQAEAERQRLAAEEAAQREREVAAAAEAERQRQSADEEAQRARQAAVEAEALRQRLAVEAELQHEREAAAAADREREAESLAAAAELSPPPSAPRDDRVETPTWQIVAPEIAPTPDSGLLDVPPTTLAPQPAIPVRPAATNGGVQATNGAGGAVNGAPAPPAGASEWPSPANTPPPQWPMPKTVAPQWPVGQGTSRGANDDLWAASSQDVLGKAGSGVQPCTSCGLPLSATARFCRRCGTQQH
jgi:hypothetical protein